MKKIFKTLSKKTLLSSKTLKLQDQMIKKDLLQINNPLTPTRILEAKKVDQPIHQLRKEEAMLFGGFLVSVLFLVSVEVPTTALETRKRTKVDKTISTLDSSTKRLLTTEFTTKAT